MPPIGGPDGSNGSDADPVDPSAVDFALKQQSFSQIQLMAANSGVCDADQSCKQTCRRVAQTPASGVYIRSALGMFSAREYPFGVPRRLRS